jgi:hypothetical protein
LKYEGKFSYRTFSSGLPRVRDERLSRSPFIVLVDNGFVTGVIFDVFDEDEDDADASITVEEVNSDGCSDRTIDEEEDDD